MDDNWFFTVPVVVWKLQGSLPGLLRTGKSNDLYHPPILYILISPLHWFDWQVHLMDVLYLMEFLRCFLVFFWKLVTNMINAIHVWVDKILLYYNSRIFWYKNCPFMTIRGQWRLCLPYFAIPGQKYKYFHRALLEDPGNLWKFGFENHSLREFIIGKTTHIWSLKSWFCLLVSQRL